MTTNVVEVEAAMTVTSGVYSNKCRFGDEDCNIEVTDDSRMLVTLPNNYNRSGKNNKEIYDMRSIIESIQELNRRTATFNCNVSFLTAMEQYDVSTEPNDKFSCDDHEDGLPAARDGMYTTTGNDNVITAGSIAALQEAINNLYTNYTALQNNYYLLKAATTIETFIFTTHFTLPSTDAAIRKSYTQNKLYVPLMYANGNPSHLLNDEARQHIAFMPVISALADRYTFNDTSISLKDIIVNYNIHDITINNGVNSMVGFPVQRYSNNGQSKLAFIMGTTNTICALGYPILELFIDNGTENSMTIKYTNNASAGEFEEPGSEYQFGLLGDGGVSISIRYTKTLDSLNGS
jgi:hypothetical protein